MSLAKKSTPGLFFRSWCPLGLFASISAYKSIHIPTLSLHAHFEFLSPSYLKPTLNLHIVSLTFSNPTMHPQLFLPSQHAVINKKANCNNKTAGTNTCGPIQQLSSNANSGPSTTTHSIHTCYASISSTCFISTSLQAPSQMMHQLSTLSVLPRIHHLTQH